MFFYSISFDTDDVLSNKPSANVFVFAVFKIHHKDSLTFL